MTEPTAFLTESDICRKLSDLEKEQELLLLRQKRYIDTLLAQQKRYGSKTRGGASRIIEDGMAIVGVVLIVSRAVIEGGQEIGVFAYPPNHHSGWAVLLEFLRSSLLVAPKALGIATAGKVWTTLGAGFGKLVSRGTLGKED